MCISQARSRHILVNIIYLQELVHKLFLQGKQAESYYACIHVYFLSMLRHPKDMQCHHVHLIIETMEAGESIVKAEGLDSYASISFKNATRGKNKCLLLLFVLSVLQIQISIREKLFPTTPSAGVLCTNQYKKKHNSHFAMKTSTWIMLHIQFNSIKFFSVYKIQ